MTDKPTGNTPDQGADRSADRKPREVRGDLIERAKRAVAALRTPDHSLANVANTIRQSIADVIEAQQRWIDRYGLALMMIREGCVDPEKFADETLSADVTAISALNTIVVTPEMEAAGRAWARAHDPSTFADIFAAMWRPRPDPHGREATALAAQDARIKELEGVLAEAEGMLSTTALMNANARMALVLTELKRLHTKHGEQHTADIIAKAEAR